MNAIAPMSGEENAVWRPSAALNPERMLFLWNMAEKIANTSLVPKSLKTEGSGNNEQTLPHETVVANVFAVVEQADRWNISPFALLSCAAIVHGKLGFEGKVIASVLESLFGVHLRTYFKGEAATERQHIYLCDEDLPDDVIEQLKPGYRHDRYRIMDGSVAEWKTSGNNSPWRPATFAKMLVYRGVREWCRVYKPAAIMGVLADDELQQIQLETMAQRAAPTLAQRFTAPSGAHGFDAANVTRQIEQNSTLPMETVDTATGEVILETAPHSSTVEPAAHNSSGTGSNPVAGTNTAESAAPADSGASRTEGDASLPPLAREVFEQFSGALLRVNKSENLTKAKEEFFRGKGMKINETDLALFQRIYAQHEDRIARSLDRAKFAVDVAKMIAHEVPEERL